ncbi:PREDICTED: putative nuclease HARBI1 [Polistes dominula]|uniref:Nuclease HARBI1 n=1 Tax=Polistes dominula TaxID=743375 RepID=A0ABM1JAD9_POLDO|nr:PREDICTED: putative nuclease HARBI1 [Polistes dominula]
MTARSILRDSINPASFHFISEGINTVFIFLIHFSLLIHFLLHFNYSISDELQHSDFVPKNNFGKTPINGKICFLIFLWFLSNTEPLRTIADRFDISMSSVHRVLRRVLAWMLTKLDDVVKWSENNDGVLTICNGFYSKKQIPNILGAIDSTHIRIEKPAENGNDFFNRKKYCSMNLQAVVDSHTRFTNVYCGEPGSLDDARVFRRSSLYHLTIENEEMLFPNNTFLIGDSAYPSLRWLVPPFRMAVEKSFGLLKDRFRRIKLFSEYRDLSFVTDTVLAACILHNYCVDENDDIDDKDIEDGWADNSESNIEENPSGNIDNQNNQGRRESLFKELYL